jgi:hypothetical protein
MEKKEVTVIRERRKHKRSKKVIKFRITPEEQQDIVGETNDLSCVGANCKMNSYVPEMTKLELTLSLPDGEESFEGIVVRCDKVKEDEYDTAIYFSQISNDIRKKINDFIDPNSEEQEFKIDG